MKAVEFESTVTAEGRISLPPEVVDEIPAGEQVRVVVMWGPSSDNSFFRAAGLRRFQSAYSPEDDVYEQLLDDTPTV
jgi:hypothetical protein